MRKSLVALLLLCSLALAAETMSDFSLPPRANGKKSAPVTLDIFTDFQCSHCREYYLHTLTRLMENECPAGKVYVVHHEFPLRANPVSTEAAKWALASTTVGKYDAVSEAFFDKQPEWTQTRNLEGVVASVMTADQLAQVKKTMAEHNAELESVIQADLFAGNVIRVDRTPTTQFSYNGKLTQVVPGEISYSIIKKMIEETAAGK